MKRIGLIGGTSPESTLYYYSKLVEESRRRFEINYYPEIVIFSLNFKKFRELPTWKDKKEYIMEGIRALETSGAEIIALTANTPHIIFDELQSLTDKKMVSIIDAVGNEAKRQNLKSLLLLGTKVTMTSGFYREKLENMGFIVLIPSEREMEEINRIIFEELATGSLKSKDFLVSVVEKYEDAVDGVILGCTELPLALYKEDASIPLLDSAEIHVRAILDEALKP